MKVSIPEIAENVSRAEVARVLVAQGDEVKADQPLLELEADKASFELPSPGAGTVDSIDVTEGDEVEVGQTVMTLRDSDSESEPEDSEPESEESEPEPEEPDSDSDSEPEPEGPDSEPEASEPDSDSEPEPEEPDSEPESEEPEPEGPDSEPEASEPEPEASEPEPEPEDSEPEPEPEAEASEPESDAERDTEPPARAAPSTRKLARELGVALSDVSPDDDGRITATALKRHVRERLGDSTSDSGSRGDADERRVRLSRLRRTVAERMTEAWRTIPHVTQHDLVDVAALERARRRLAEAHPDGPKITLATLVARAAVSALGDHPRLNARLDESGESLVIVRRVHLGVAVDTERGLMVPVIRDAQDLDLQALAERIGDVAQRAREGEVDLDELRGATFSLTNVGAIGGRFFTPIIPAPQVAILGMGRAAASGDDERLELPLSLSYDHRVVDGADGMRFLAAVGERLTSPLALA